MAANDAPTPNPTLFILFDVKKTKRDAWQVSSGLNYDMMK
jgi:hypothetical protein